MTKCAARFVLVLLWLFSGYAHAVCATFMSDGARFDLSISSGFVRVEKDGAIYFEKQSSERAADAAFMADFNFDGIPDVAVLRDAGIERYFDVYVFDEKSGGYLLNKSISELACPAVDVRKKLVLSTCNHASACEVWTDSFAISAGSELKLVRRDGTTCDPVSGQGFKYFEIYRNNKVIRKNTVSIEK